MQEFLKKLVEFFVPHSTYQSEIDAYIASKNPSTAVEVEHWIRQYENRSQKLTQVY